MARVNGKTYYEKFSNRTLIGAPTGHGDTTFAAYLAYRLDHDVIKLVKVCRGFSILSRWKRLAHLAEPWPMLLTRMRTAYTC